MQITVHSAYQPVIGVCAEELGHLAGHVRESFVDAAGLAGVVEVGVTVSDSVSQFVGDDVLTDQRVQIVAAVTEGHVRSVPESVLVASAELQGNNVSV